MKQQIPTILLLTGARGAIGKSFVIRRTRYGYVISRFPDFSKVIPTPAQIRQRNLYRDAASFVKWIMSNDQRKAAFAKMLPRHKRKLHLSARLVSYYCSCKMVEKENLKRKINRSKTTSKPLASKQLSALKFSDCSWRLLWNKERNITCRYEFFSTATRFRSPEIFLSHPDAEQRIELAFHNSA